MKMNAPMKEYTVLRDNLPDIAFTGSLLGSASSRKPGHDRWTQLDLYQTETGQYVGVKIGRTILPGEINLSSAAVSFDLNEVLPLFMRGGRVSWLTKMLLEECNLQQYGVQRVA